MKRSTLNAINEEINKDAHQQVMVDSISKEAMAILLSTQDVDVNNRIKGGYIISSWDESLVANDSVKEIKDLYDNTLMRVWTIRPVKSKVTDPALKNVLLYLVQGFGRSILTTKIPFERLMDVEVEQHEPVCA